MSRENNQMPVCANDTLQDNESLPVVLENETGIRNVASKYPSFFAPIFKDLSVCRNNLLKDLSAQMPNAINIVQTANSAAAYRPVGNIVLQQGKDGLFSAVLRDENGHILEHVKLEKASSDFTRAASFSYSIVNAIVGQANMMEIAGRLKAIETALDEVKKRQYIVQINTIKTKCEGLKEVLCLSDDDHQRQTTLLLRTDLRNALGTLKDYIIMDINNMPEYHEKSRWESLISNWGSESQTLPEQARKRFEYVSWSLPYWFYGMSELVSTEPYVRKDGEFYSDADRFTADVKDIVIETGLSSRAKYLPMMGKTDPIKLVEGIEQGIPKMEQYFNQMQLNPASGNRILEIKAN